MSDLLKPKQVVHSASGYACRVLSFIGGGGQGEVYRAELDGREVALKWYFAPSATDEQRNTLEALIEHGKPSDVFLWPEDIASEPNVPGFGYIMRLRPPRYKSLNQFVAGRIRPAPSALSRISFCLELTKAFRQLHTSGLSYRDINFGNAFFDPTCGDVLVCDNDNVSVNRTGGGGVGGTPDFMAPELVRGDKAVKPSTNTDLHSLAVLHFYTMFLGHPLQGRKMLNIRSWDPPARRKLLGREPVFIFDPQDKSNEAVTLAEDPLGEAGDNPLRYWDIYPSALKEEFTRAFTIGLKDPYKRVTEYDWLQAFSQLRDSMFRCPCDTPNYYDKKRVRDDGSYLGVCWACKKPLKLPFRIRIDKRIVMLSADAKLYPHHMCDGRDYQFDKAVGEITRHPTDPNLWGLKNLTTDKWVATLPNGTHRDVEPGKSVPLAVNARVDFGRVQGEIRY